MSDDAAALRKLWFLAKELCKSELEKLDLGEDSSKVRVGVAAATAMEEEAIGNGVPYLKPSLFCLTRLARIQPPMSTFRGKPL